MLSEIAECIGGHSLASVCRLLAEDHSGWSGQPPGLTSLAASCNDMSSAQKALWEASPRLPYDSSSGLTSQHQALECDDLL